MIIKGNIGEWSELYVLLKLLAEGRLYAADSDLKKLPDVYSPLLRIFRHEAEKLDLEYKFSEKKHIVELYINGDKIKTIKSEWITESAESIYTGMMSGSEKGAFTIEGSDEVLRGLNIEKIKAPSTDKKDITVQIHDVQTGRDNIVGFSIKSDLGGSPSLFNASGHTNFVYEITGINDADMEEINNISSRTKIIDRLTTIQEKGNISYIRMDSDIFHHNLMFIDSMMDDILAIVVLTHYTKNIADVSDIVTEIENDDPMGYENPGIYRYKMKKFLCAIALGMVPGRSWDGRDEASGGYIIVKRDGDVVAYHLYNRDSFETYLLNNTRLDRPSMSRYKYAEIYKEDGRYFIKLNLQIRFKKNG